MTKQSLYRKQKHTKRSRLTPVVITIISLVALAIGSIVLWNHLSTPTQDSSASKVSFNFNSDDLNTDWWSSGSTWPDPAQLDSDYADTILPVVSLVAFQGAQQAGDDIDQCFVSASYYEGAINIDDAISEKKTQMTAGRDGSSLAILNSANLSMPTYDGNKPYTLHKFDLTPPEGEDYKRGNAFGYIQMSDGYVAIMSVCPTAKMLDDTHQALSAISLHLPLAKMN